MAHNRIDGLVEQLHSQGFDQSYHVISAGYQPRQRVHSARVKCSQCEALVICGVPAHETGCPNTVYECKGCSGTVARAGAYCQECSQ